MCPFDPAATPTGPPPGVPDSPQSNGLIHEDLIAQNAGMIHEDQIAQSIPDPQPASPGLIHEDQIAAQPSPAPGGLGAVADQGQKLGGLVPPAAQAGMEDIRVRPQSLVGKAFSGLAIPLEVATGRILDAAEVLRVPGAQELNEKLNPDRKLIPDAVVSDISDFYIDKASQAAGIPDMPGAEGAFLRGAVATTKFGIGLGANFLLDPMASVKVGALTEEAEAIQKQGGKVLNPDQVKQGVAAQIDRSVLDSPAAKEKNLLTIQHPLFDARADIKGQPVQDMIQKVADSPAVQSVAKAIRTLSPDTGHAILDQAGNTHDALKRGDPVDIINRYSAAKDALKMTSDEDRIASALVESTPNLAPHLPQDVLRAAEKRPMEGGSTADGNPNFWSDEASLRRNMSVIVDDTAKKLGLEIAPGRQEAIVEAAIMSKRAGAENLMDKYHAGVLNQANIADKVMENHLPRVVNPAYKGVKNLAEYEARLASDEAEVRRSGSGTFVSTKDPTRMREVTRGKTLEEANAQMKDAKGLDQYFITDPVKAQVARLIESKKLLRDSQYMDVVKDYGTKMGRGEARQAGMVSIDHPELDAKHVVIKNADGSILTVRHNELFYPPDIASKVQYRIAPPALTGLKASLRDYNRVFRSAIFASSPGMRIANSVDNVLKTAAVTGGDFIRASKDAYQVLLGKSAGFRSEPTALRPGGTFYSGTALKSLLDKYGITRTNAWTEGMSSVVDAGKKLTVQDAMQRPGALMKSYAWERAKDLFKTVTTFGERGENTARAALFLQRLRAGWEPEQAANEVTKWLFDYNRNSPAMENVRFAMPFMQHPFKTALIAPELLGTAPGAYNFIQNTFPHVVANAFHDPVSQKEINTILPDSIKQRDGIAGPFISGNTWMATIFGAKDPKIGSLAWFDPRIGMRILNHFDYLSKGGTDRLIGETSPVLQALVGMAGRGDFGKSLDYANGNVNVANRVNYALSKIIGGVSPFPNTEKMAMQAFGLEDPKHVEPYSVLIMKGMAGQFGGITNLDRDVQSKLLSTHYAFMDQKKQLLGALKQEMNGNMDSPSVFRYVKATYKSITGTTPAQIAQQMNQTSQEQSEAQMGAQALGGGMSAGDFAARMKGLHAEMGRLNQAYQTLGARYLQMAGEKKH